MRLLITLLLFLTSWSVMAQVDTVYSSRGQKVYGEIKKMARGVIFMATSYSESDFRIDWDYVTGVYSRTQFIITAQNHYIIGHLEPSNKEGEVIVVASSDSSRFVIPLISILKMESFEDRFLDRLYASISLGYSLQKTNNVQQLSLRSSIGYNAERWSLAATGNSVNSSQDSIQSTRRFDGNFSVKRTTSSKLFTNYQIDLLQNDEQLLQLRTNQKLGFGYYVKRNHAWYFSVNSGMSWNNEVYTDESIRNLNSAEIFAAYEINLFNVKDFSLVNSVFCYYTVGGVDRVRLDSKLDLKYDMPLDFYIQAGITHNFDSNPVSGAARTDYVIQTTFGWNF